MMNLRGPSLLALAAVLSGCGAAATTVEPTPEVTEAPAPAGAAEVPVDPVAAALGAPATENDQASLDALDRAAEALASGDLAGARSEFTALLDVPAVSARASYNLGVIAFAEQQDAQAVEYFEAALRSDPSFAPALAGIVRLALRDDDLVSARRAVESQSRASDNAPAIRAIGLYITLAEGRFEQVIRDGRALMLEDDANLDVFYAMGAANLGLGRVELARYIFQEGVERDDTRPEFFFGLAEIEMAADNNPGARTWLRRALDAQPFHPEAWNNLGVLYLATRAFDEAVEAFENATRYAPAYREAWLNLGSAYKGAQRYDDAVTAFNTAIEFDRTYADPYFNLGVLYLDTEIGGLTRIERYQQSITYFEQYRDRAGAIPADHQFHGYLAQAQTLYQTQVELESAPPPSAEPEPSEEGTGEEDEWGDDWGDEWGDDGAEGSGDGGDDWEDWK